MTKSKQRKQRPANDSPAWWTVGGPFAVVFAMLFLGVVLRSPTDGGQSLSSEPVRHRQPFDLAMRAADDAARLGEHRGAWTLQFMMACTRENLEPIVEALSEQHSLFLLHYPERGADCYRICWGWFDSKTEAQEPRVYPEVLSDIDAPLARPIDDVLP